MKVAVVTVPRPFKLQPKHSGPKPCCMMQERPDPTGGYGKKVTAVPCLSTLEPWNLRCEEINA